MMIISTNDSDNNDLFADLEAAAVTSFDDSEIVFNDDKDLSDVMDTFKIDSTPTNNIFMVPDEYIQRDNDSISIIVTDTESVEEETISVEDYDCDDENTIITKLRSNIKYYSLLSARTRSALLKITAGSNNNNNIRLSVAAELFPYAKGTELRYLDTACQLHRSIKRSEKSRKSLLIRSRLESKQLNEKWCKEIERASKIVESVEQSSKQINANLQNILCHKFDLL